MSTPIVSTSDLATFDSAAVPLDETSRAALAERGLGYVTVDPSEEGGESFARWSEAVNRGFLGERSTPEQIESWRTRAVGSRVVGVTDPAGALPEQPVATVQSWAAELTVDDGRTIPSWGISAVTVSSTHRRRGIARALLGGELRAARDAGLPIAGLTVSEATIYGRYGFGPAAGATRWRIDARRAGWVGPQPVRDGRGRLDPVEREAVQSDLRELFGRIRVTRPGEFEPEEAFFVGFSGLNPAKPDLKLRGVRYTDAAGVTRGVITYRMSENMEDYRSSTMDVDLLLAETTDAYAALWHYALTHDLVGTVNAGELSTDEPLRWMVEDQRALRVTESDHHWLRILDVPHALAARGYRTSGAFVLDVVDPLGIAGGTFRLEIDDDGNGVVTPADAAATPGEGVVRLGISELSSLYLGGVSSRTLLAAGRIETDDATAARFDAAFAAVRPPLLSYWY